MSVFCLVFKQSLSLRVKILNLTWPGITWSRIRTAWPKWLILASFFSGENTPSIDTSHYLQLLPEVHVCRSVLFGPPCIDFVQGPPGSRRERVKIIPIVSTLTYDLSATWMLWTLVHTSRAKLIIFCIQMGIRPINQKLAEMIEVWSNHYLAMWNLHVL